VAATSLAEAQVIAPTSRAEAVDAFGDGSGVTVLGGGTINVFGNIVAEAGAVLAGAPFPYVAKNKVSFSARYRLPLPASAGDLGVMATYSYQTQQSIAQTNDTVYPYIPGYGLINARLDWRNALSGPLEVSAFVTNLTNKTYAIGQFDSFNSSFGFVTRTYGEPRMYGLQLRYAFGK